MKKIPDTIGILSNADPCPPAWQTLGSLWFAGPDLYRKKDVAQGGDPREGTFPLELTHEEICRIGAEKMGLSPEEAEKKKEKYFALNPAKISDSKKLRTRLCGVTCWHHNTNEDKRMWQDYVGDKGVVILTTMAKLQASLETVWETVQDQAKTNSPLSYPFSSGPFRSDGIHAFHGIDGFWIRKSLQSSQAMNVMANCTSVARPKTPWRPLGLPIPYNARMIRPRLCAAAAIW